SRFHGKDREVDSRFHGNDRATNKVIPSQEGIQRERKRIDTRFHGNDKEVDFRLHGNDRATNKVRGYLLMRQPHLFII
ncbi:MAG: hypothetical protein WCZ17_10160, partial [Candidatus Kapaibacterium sp.]